LTSGRYVDVTVDPASLDVLVQTESGRRRRVKHLSQGTREQIYLLLRVALAEHLARPGEIIPSPIGTTPRTEPGKRPDPQPDPEPLRGPFQGRFLCFPGEQGQTVAQSVWHSTCSVGPCDG
jgi:hypothetical protein